MEIKKMAVPGQSNKKTVLLADLGTDMGRELLPLGIGYILGYCKSIPSIENAYQFHINFLDRDVGIATAGLSGVDVLGIGVYDWNKNASLKFSQSVKMAFPNCTIILGGPSVPRQASRIEPFMINNPFVDILVHNEGEKVFANVLETLNTGDDLSTVDGITFRTPKTERGFITSPDHALITDLEEIPSPYLTGIFDEILMRHHDRVTGTVLETNRGCPYSCTFCDWGAGFVRKVRKFSIERTFSELEWISSRQIFYVYNADANFGIFYERDLQIAEKIAALYQKTSYPGYLRSCWTKNSNKKIVKIFDTLQNAGVESMVTLSMQSYNPSTLSAIKRKNISHKDYLELKSEFSSRNDITYTELILGLPNETYASFRDGISNVMTDRLQDLICFYPCSMIENAELSTSESRDLYKLQTRFCPATAFRTSKKRRKSTTRPDLSGDQSHRFSGLTQYEFLELDEIVVGTSTMTINEWKRSFIYGHILWALYFYRTAFFVLIFMKNEISDGDTSYGNIIEFIIETTSLAPKKFPQLHKAIDYLRRQADLIVNNGPMVQQVRGYGDRLFQPNEGAMTILLDNPDRFFRELRNLTLEYASRQSNEVDEALVDEIILYQRSRTPVYPHVKPSVIYFEYDVPKYFEKVLQGDSPDKLQKEPCTMNVKSPTSQFANKRDFAIWRVDKGITLKIFDI